MPMALTTDEKKLWKYGLLQKCGHGRSRIVATVTDSGRQARREQCCDCGKLGGVVKIELARDAQPIDQAAADEWEAKFRASSQAHGAIVKQNWAMRATAKVVDDQEYWAGYNAYLNSPQWRMERERILVRDQRICQALLPGCTTKATQVHHRGNGEPAYRLLAQLGSTPAYLLASICGQCHALITAADRQWAKSGRPKLLPIAQSKVADSLPDLPF